MKGHVRLWCIACGRWGDIPEQAGDEHVSPHGFAVCALHANFRDRRYPGDPAPAPFMPDPQAVPDRMP